MLIQIRNLCRTVAAVSLLVALPGSATAQTCTNEQIADAVDLAGAALRDITRVNQPRLDDRLRALSRRNNWTEAEATEKALDLLADARTASLDRTANELLSKIDQLGNVPPRATPECSRLQELEAASLELQAAVKAKSAYMIARADSLLAGSAAAAPVVPAPATAIAKAAPLAEVKAQPMGVPPATTTTAVLPPTRPWSTTTTVAPPVVPPPAATSPTASTSQTAGAQTLPPMTLPQTAPLPSVTPGATPSPRDDETFTIDEVVRASTGVFGKVSAGLGSVVEFAFSSIGRPTGYIIGEEGGGAFLAGLRYGKGMLHMRDGQTMPVYWHGPSLGLDFGAQGAKVMFLVYRMRQPDQLFFPYSSLEGAAFLAGGLGLTLMTNGETQLAPIRSGIGLRVGASVGYVRFTRKPTWNPF